MWLTVNDIEGTAPPPKPQHTGVWSIAAKWIEDLDVFNEYMNERDYEIDSMLQEKQYRKPPPKEEPEQSVSFELGKRPLEPSADEPPEKKIKLESEVNKLQNSFYILSLVNINIFPECSSTTHRGTKKVNSNSIPSSGVVGIIKLIVFVLISLGKLLL
jgi:hypothetical protein